MIIGEAGWCYQSFGTTAGAAFAAMISMRTTSPCQQEADHRALLNVSRGLPLLATWRINMILCNAVSLLFPNMPFRALCGYQIDKRAGGWFRACSWLVTRQRHYGIIIITRWRWRPRAAACVYMASKLLNRDSATMIASLAPWCLFGDKPKFPSRERLHDAVHGDADSITSTSGGHCWRSGRDDG